MFVCLFCCRISLFFTVHAYERLWPVLNGTVVQKSYVNSPVPIYITNGAAGNVEGHPDLYKQDYDAYVDVTAFGYSKLTVYNATDMRYQFFNSTNEALIDEIYIHRDRV